MNLDPSTLRISVTEGDRWRRHLSVTIPSAIVREEERKAASKLASRARLKGFRKGRVPKSVIESRFGGALRQEALDSLVSAAYRQALAAEELHPISEGELEELSYEPEADLTFAIAFDVEPIFELDRLGGFAAERPAFEVTDEQVAAVLARIQEQNGVWQPAESGTPEDGDLVSVKIVRLHEDGPADEGRDYDLVLGQGDAIPDIEAAIRTLEPGATDEFDIGFPEDFADESRRGEHERIRVTLTSRRTLDVPDLDDDLARQVGDFETLAELRAKVRDDMEQEAAQRADQVVRGRLLDLVVEANPFDVPASMVGRYADSVIGDTKEIPEERLREFREQIRPEAERAVKRILVIERIADTQDLRAGDDKIDARVEKIAEANNADVAKVYAELQKAGRLEAIERELTEDAVFEFLMEKSEITDAPSA